MYIYIKIYIYLYKPMKKDHFADTNMNDTSIWNHSFLKVIKWGLYSVMLHLSRERYMGSKDANTA